MAIKSQIPNPKSLLLAAGASVALIAAGWSGRLPFWNPWQCGGEPVWQNPAASVITASALRLLMPLPVAVRIDSALHYGAVLLIPCVPILLFRRDGSVVRHAVLAAVVLAAIIFDGGLPAMPLTVLMLALIGIVVGILATAWRALAASALTVCVGLGLAAPRLLPASLFGVGRDACISRADQPIVYSDDPLRVFGTTVTSTRIEARVTAMGQGPVTLILNQNFHEGWSSDVASVTRHRQTGNPSIVLPAGFAGRVHFQFTPPGFWAGVLLFVIAAAIAAAAWTWPERVDQTSRRVWTISSPVRTAITAHAIDLTMLAAAVGGFLWIYNRYPYRPTLPDNGWWNYFDQSQYLRSARAMMRGDFSPGEHVYPIGYPILAVPFLNLLPRDPFLPVNLGLFGAFAWLYFRLFKPVIGAPLAAAAFFGALVFPTEILTPQHIGYPIWSQFVIPWTTNGVAPLYAGALVAMRFNWERARPPVDFLIGLMLGAAACVRPADAVPLGVLIAAYGIRRVWRRDFALSVWIALGVLVGVAPLLLFMWRVYAGGVSPYLRNVGTAGLFTFSNLPQRAYQMLLRSEETYGEVQSALFEVQPWLYAAVPLAIAWAVGGGAIASFAVVLVLSSWVLYLAYNDLTPFNILRFFLVHYFVWALPVVAAAAVAGALDIIRKRRWRAATIVVVAAAMLVAVRLVPDRIAGAQVSDESLALGARYTVALGSPQRIDAIDIVVPFSPRENIITVAQKDINLTVDGMEFNVLSGYQVLRWPDGLRIIFKRRVTAHQVAFTLDDGFERVRDAAEKVKLVRFRFALWQKK